MSDVNTTRLNSYERKVDRYDDESEACFQTVESQLIIELTEAECIEDVYDLVYLSLQTEIEHYGYHLVPENLLPDFWKVYGLKEAE